MRTEFLELHPFGALDLSHPEYLLKYVVSKFVSIQVKSETSTIAPSLVDCPVLITKLPKKQFFNREVSVSFYHDYQTRFLLAIENEAEQK